MRVPEDNLKYVKAEKGEYPICPFCEQELQEVKYKNLFGSGFARGKLIFFCPHCRKVLGNSDADSF